MISTAFSGPVLAYIIFPNAHYFARWPSQNVLQQYAKQEKQYAETSTSKGVLGKISVN